MPTGKRKKKKTKVNTILLCVMLAVMAVSAGALGWNMYKINSSAEDTDNDIKEDKEDKPSDSMYIIGKDPISIGKTYFEELNKAVDSGDHVQISSALVKCFVTEYYTWTNKQGNFDIGGIQYIFTDRQSDFASYTRNDYYADMDLYISQLGSKNLMQVSEVTVTDAVESEDMVVLNTAGEEVTYPCVTVTAQWSYESCSMDLSAAQTGGVFQVVNHDGRMEIASIQ